MYGGYVDAPNRRIVTTVGIPPAKTDTAPTSGGFLVFVLVAIVLMRSFRRRR